MPQDQVSTRHHYIPEFYLKRWASGKGTLIQFSKPHGDIVKPKRVYPRQTGFVNRLYEMRGVPPERSHLFETAFFRPVDTMAAAVLAKIEAGLFDLNDRERSAWSDFIMSLILRHPEQVAGIRDQMAQDIARTPRKMRARFVLPDDKPVDVTRAMAELSTENGIARVAMSTLTRTVRGSRTGAAIINLRWGVIRAPVFAAVLTSDRPVLWMGTLSTPDFNLMLPIGPKTIFWAAPCTLSAAQMMGVDAGILVDMLNDHVTRRAKRFVYGFGDAALSYVQSRMGIDPMPTIVDRLLELRLDRRRNQLRLR